MWHKAVFCIHYKNEIGDFYDTVGANDDFWSRKTEIIGNVHEIQIQDDLFERRMILNGRILK